MRKALLGTSALALAMGITSTAPSDVSAAEFEMNVGGYYEVQFGFGTTENAPVGNGPASRERDIDGFDVKRDAEIHFKPAMTLDNGIRIGAHVELEGAAVDGQVDNAFIDVNGSFGRLVLGSESSAGNLMHYSAPSDGMLGANDGDLPNWIRWQNGTSGMATNHELAGGDTERITYFTPRISGFQFGVSYARDDETHSNEQVDASIYRDGIHPSFENADNAAHGIIPTSLRNIVDLGLNYVGDTGGIDIATSVRYGIAFTNNRPTRFGDVLVDTEATFGTLEDGTACTSAAPCQGQQLMGQPGRPGLRYGDHNPQVWSAGLNLGWENWTIGASFGERNLNDDSDGQSYDAGIAYNNGPWTYTFTWFHGENALDGEELFAQDARPGFQPFNIVAIPHDGNGIIGDTETLDTFVLGVKYALAKGVDLHGFAGYISYRADGHAIYSDGVIQGYAPDRNTADTTGFVVGSGMIINF